MPRKTKFTCKRHGNLAKSDIVYTGDRPRCRICKRAWFVKNAERCKAVRKAYYDNNAEKLKKKQRKYYRENVEYYREKNRENKLRAKLDKRRMRRVKR